MYWKKKTFTSKVQAWTGIKGGEGYIKISYFSTRIDSQNEPYSNHHYSPQDHGLYKHKHIMTKRKFKAMIFFFLN